ncbi:hypothetical protein P3W53_06245 [Pseudomonas denitrificans (nom. rej.)]|nr:hypothetical protein [Pseudomonas denitrificans (nom. rej.)]
MSETRTFTVNYRLHDQPYSIEVNSFSGSLTPDQARFYVQSRHAEANPADITEIQIERP